MYILIIFPQYRLLEMILAAIFQPKHWTSFVLARD